MKKRSLPIIALLIITVITLLTLPYTVAMYFTDAPLYPGIHLGVLILLTGALLWQNRKAIGQRAIAFGLHSVVTTVLVLCILVVINLFAHWNSKQFDLTREKTHTLSPETETLIKRLDVPVSATVFTNFGSQMKYRPLLENYRILNESHFKYEFVDPNKEPTIAKEAGLKRAGDSVFIRVGDKSLLIEEIAEDKITNTLAKLIKKKSQTLCVVTGHGEKDFQKDEEPGYSSVRKGLEEQSYVVKEIDLIQDPKIPESCDAIAIIGPQKSFLAKEIDSLGAYLEAGGRLLVSFDFNIKGRELSPELSQLLKKWFIKITPSLVLDPSSRMAGLDAAAPIYNEFSKTHAITRDFKTDMRKTYAILPFAQVIEFLPNSPPELKLEWIARSLPTAWGETDFNSLKTREIKFNEGVDIKGPVIGALALEGKLSKDSKAPRNTRIVVLATSEFAINRFLRAGLNEDLIFNSASWVLEDESSISIRPKKPEQGKLELTRNEQMIILWLSVVIVPATLVMVGIFNWWRRRKL